jgi:hypothetical protein
MRRGGHGDVVLVFGACMHAKKAGRLSAPLLASGIEGYFKVV